LMPHHFFHDPPSEVRGPFSLPRMLCLVARRNTRWAYKVCVYPPPSQNHSAYVRQVGARIERDHATTCQRSLTSRFLRS
jgi:hypothetical protein